MIFASYRSRATGRFAINILGIPPLVALVLRICASQIKRAVEALAQALCETVKHRPEARKASHLRHQYK